MLDPKGLEAAYSAGRDYVMEMDDRTKQMLRVSIGAYLSTITPAEAGGLVGAQIEARAIAQLFDDIYVRDGFCDWADVATARDEALRLHATALEAQEAELVAMKTKADCWQAEFLNACRDAASFSDDLLRTEAALAEARKALEPFAEVEWADEIGWNHDAPYRERICDWFGPSDFRVARRIREGGKADG